MKVWTTRTYLLDQPGEVGRIRLPGRTEASTLVNDGRVDAAVLSNPRIAGVEEAREILRTPCLRQAMAELVMERSSPDYSEARDCALNGEQSSAFSNVLDHASLESGGLRRIQMPGPNGGQEEWFVSLVDRDRCRSFHLGPRYGNQSIEFSGAALTLKTHVPTSDGVLRQHILSDWDPPAERAAAPREIFLLESEASASP